MAIPLPGPGKKMRHAGFLNWGVMLCGGDHVKPASELLTNSNWPVSYGVRPRLDPAIELLP